MIKRALLATVACSTLLLAQGQPAQEPFPEAARPFLQEFQRKAQQNDIKGALEALGKAIQAAPQEKRLWFIRGDVQRRVGKFEPAIADFSKVIELDNSFANAYRMRGLCYQYGPKDVTKASADFDKAVELAPQDPEAHVGRARLRAMTGDIQGALKDFTKVTELAAEWGPGYLSRAEIFSALGNYKKAMEEYDNAMFLFEGQAQASVLMSRARTKFLMGDAEAAKKDADAALQTAPSHQMHFSRGLLRHDMGDFKGCIEDMRKAIELDEQNSHEYGRYYISLSQMRLGNNEAAATEMAGYLDKREKKDDWYTRIGGFLAGRITADDLLAAAKDQNPQTTREQTLEVCWYVGATRLAKGDKEGAKKLFEQALKIPIYQFIEFQSIRAAMRTLAPAPEKTPEKKAGDG
jgi:tetratricopeptide (TPR) repeat protein